MSEQAYYIYGRNAVTEALSSGSEIEKIYILYGLHGTNPIFKLAKSNKVPVITFDKMKFKNLEDSVLPRDAKSQGVIALRTMAKTVDLGELADNAFARSNKPVLLILDGITDPQNLGAIARSAECAGVTGIVMPIRNSAPITPVAVKASAGALEHLDICKVTNLVNAIETLKDKGFWIYGADMQSTRLYSDNIYDRPIVIIIGSEGSGMKENVRKKCDEIISIPMSGRINSLNASVSAGIVLFEINRQRMA
jgi:23S rRNA (guanosine2251-2'-O)-methyltransferase